MTAAASLGAVAADPFDALAPGYDESFGESPIGRRLRAAVERRLFARFAAGDRVLDLGCGTGEDAVRLARRGVEVVAVDASAAMVAAARAKVAAAGVGERVTVLRTGIEELAERAVPGSGRRGAVTEERSAREGPPTAPRSAGSASAGAAAAGRASRAASRRGGAFEHPDAGVGAAGGSPDRSGTGEAAPFPDLLLVGGFDGVLSNFGALNCVGDLRALAVALACIVRPGGAAVLCVMGPLAPWEWLLGALRLDPRLALRRLRPGGVRWRGRLVRYPSPRGLRRAFAPWFATERLAAVGALLPPPSFAARAARHPRLLDRLDRWERRWETLPPLPWLADHFLLELVRR